MSSSTFPTPDLFLGVGVVLALLAMTPPPAGVLFGCGGVLAEAAFLVLGDLEGVNLALESLDAIPGMNIDNFNVEEEAGQLLTTQSRQCFHSKPGNI